MREKKMKKQLREIFKLPLFCMWYCCWKRKNERWRKIKKERKKKNNSYLWIRSGKVNKESFIFNVNNSTTRTSLFRIFNIIFIPMIINIWKLSTNNNMRDNRFYKAFKRFSKFNNIFIKNVLTKNFLLNFSIFILLCFLRRIYRMNFSHAILLIMWLCDICIRGKTRWCPILG